MITYTSIYRLAVREALRTELDRALKEIEQATHAVVLRSKSEAYCIGSRRDCETFANGLRHVAVVELTTAMRDHLVADKISAYRRG